MKELLQEWSRLDPEECKWHEVEGSWVVYDRRIMLALIDSDRVQSAVQVAIRLRGWHWALPNDISRDQDDSWGLPLIDNPPMKNYTAVVVTEQKRSSAKSYESYSDSPATALLLAYLKAIRNNVEAIND